jgi:hypothetical protein
VEIVSQLRALISIVDPALLTADDRLALLDLFERASVRDCSAA